MDDLMNWLKAANTATQGFLLTVLAASTGRLMFHTREVQAGRRHFWSWNLLRELPVAIGMGMIAGGGADYLGLADGPKIAFACGVAFLGPPLLQDAISFGRDLARSKAGLPPKE